MREYDCLIIGAGLVGLATAYQLLGKRPGMKVAVCEKEMGPARHQSGHNSGVVHSGVYYKPGSLKAKNCIQGRKELLALCREKNLPLQQVHKVIVAQDASEEAYLSELLARGQANEVVKPELLGPERLKEIEPHVRAIRALYLPECYIIDYPTVAEALCAEIRQQGGEIFFGEEIRGRRGEVVLGTKGEYRARTTVNCAGLHSDRIAKQFLGQVGHQICPFRGEYYLLSAAKRSLVKGLIYPVPDPKFPFLGVHLTPMINGQVEAGPNAILATAREGYRKTDFNWRDVAEIISYGGFWRLALKHWRMGLYEMARSGSKRLFVRDVQRLMPEIGEDDLSPGGAGIRAQVVKQDGSMMEDFAFGEDLHSIHVLNAPSPAATSCLSIGRTVSEKVLARGA